MNTCRTSQKLRFHWKWFLMLLAALTIVWVGRFSGVERKLLEHIEDTSMNSTRKSAGLTTGSVTTQEALNAATMLQATTTSSGAGENNEKQIMQTKIDTLKQRLEEMNRSMSQFTIMSVQKDSNKPTTIPPSASPTNKSTTSQPISPSVTHQPTNPNTSNKPTSPSSPSPTHKPTDPPSHSPTNQPTLQPTNAVLSIHPDNSSKWQLLSKDQLKEYFHPYERLGLESKGTCGHINELEEPYRWLGTNLKQDAVVRQGHFTSGPCCPNGHTHGWFGNPLNDTTPLQMAEVTSDGQMVGPYQIKTLIQALRQSNPTRKRHSIWIMGDSTSIQLWYGFICAFARIGGKVNECHYDPGRYYRHPLCHYKTGNVSHQFASFTYHDDHLQQQEDSNHHNNQSSSVFELEVHQFSEGRFCHRTPPGSGKESCQAYQARFLNFTQTLDRPNLFLVNVGLHINPDRDLAPAIEQLLDLFIPHYSHELAWRETSVTHFSDKQHTGTYEAYGRDRDRNESSVGIQCSDIAMIEQPRIRVARETINK